MAAELPMFTPQHDHTPHGEPRKGDEAAHTLAKELLENGTEPALSGRDNLNTMALVDACYKSAREHRAVELAEIIDHAS